MNSLGIMYAAEIKKIISKKSVWISLGIGMAIVLLVGFTNLSADGHGAYVKYQETSLKEISGQKLDQSFFDDFHNEVNNEITENWSNYEKIKSYDPGMMYSNASTAVGKKALYDLIYNVIRDREKIAECSADDFYQAMREDIINDGRDLGASEEEINIWLERYDSIEKPITYSYALGYSNMLEVLFIIGWMIIICTSIALSGVFADEKTNRTDALILSSRNGRIPICIAKILASITISLMQTLILLGGCFGVMLAFYGTFGWNSMIQNVIPSSPWNITIGQMVLIYLGLAAASSMFFAMTNILISQLTHSAVLTMAIHAVFIFIGLFNIPAKLGFIAKMWQLRPSMPLYYGTFCNTFRYWNMNNVEASFIIYIGCIVVMMVALLAIYRKCQVESR